jgi:Putative metal-binding motif
MLHRGSFVLVLLLLGACAPATRSPDDGTHPPDNGACPGADLQNDELNCGACAHVCGTGESCTAAHCVAETCDPGATEECYTGASGTRDVGPCHAGQHTCSANGYWGPCEGQVTPVAEVCGNGIDENCSGVADENMDQDGDGFSTCDGDCCDNTAQCGQPGLVNPGAFDAPGNSVDDDCDGMVDNAVAASCDTGLASNSNNAMDYAKAMELCQTATESDRRWGVISAKWSLPNGNGAPARDSCSIRPAFGMNVVPKAGASLFEISTGHAADKNDANPGYASFDDDSVGGADMATASPFPNDWLASHSGTLPNAPGCPAPDDSQANDPVMLTLRIRVPTNAQSFSLSTNFFSAEYPEWVCSPFNDFFVVLLDSSWNGSPANPGDKNLATYTAPDGQKYPVGVNLAKGDTGLFNQCVNGTLGCASANFGLTTTRCMSTSELVGTGFDNPIAFQCDVNSLSGGGTGWLTTSGNVKGGEIITLRIAIWDTSDHNLDSLAVIDNFKWAVTAADPGTVVN